MNSNYPDCTIAAGRPLRPSARAACRLFSEAGLIRHRVRVELAWFRHLAGLRTSMRCRRSRPTTMHSSSNLATSSRTPTPPRSRKSSARPTTTSRRSSTGSRIAWPTRPGLADKLEMVHFACTSEDINNLAYGLILKQALVEVLDPVLGELDTHLAGMAEKHAEVAMLSRTHGQSASPTTLGKEIANTVFRLRRQRRHSPGRNQRQDQRRGGQLQRPHRCLSGPRLAGDRARFRRAPGPDLEPYTTQIEPHDMIAELAHALIRINTVLLDFARDSWAYISLGYYKQRMVEGEVGSSTMPHKVNPIDFENGEGNLGLANALLGHLAEKLPVSRWQRDLTDSTVQRSIGSAFGYCLLAWRSIQRGLDRIEPAGADRCRYRRRLGSAGRSHPDRDARARHRRTLRKAQAAHPRANDRRARRARISSKTGAAGSRTPAPAGNDAGRLHRQRRGDGALPSDATHETDQAG